MTLLYRKYSDLLKDIDIVYCKFPIYFHVHPRCKKAFSSFLAISEDPLDKFYIFGLKFLLVIFASNSMCKNKDNPPTQCLTIVILLYLKWSAIMQDASFCDNRDKNVMIYVTFLLV